MNMWPTSGPEGTVTTEVRLRHILLAIQRIDASLAETLIDDLRSCMAVERLLEIIAIASAQLPASLKADPSVDWRRLAEMGKKLEHACDRVPAAELSLFSRQELPSLKTFAKRSLRETSHTNSL